MTSKERVAIAMQGGLPDRVPVMCQLSLGHYFIHSGVDPFEIWFRSEGFARALIRLQERYQFDGILVNLHGRDPDFQGHMVKRDLKSGEDWIWWDNDHLTKLPKDDNPHYYGQDGKQHFPAFDDVDPDQLFYIDPWNLTGINYPFTWDFETEPRSRANYFPSYINQTLETVLNEVGDQISVHGEIFSPFSQFLELLNYSEALTNLLVDPGKCHACLQALTKGAIELGIKEVITGADAVLISSAFAGSGFISRALYNEFVLPYEAQVVQGIKDFMNIPVYTHTCGGIGDRLDLMIETGTDGIDTLDPPPLGTVELEEAIQMTKGKVFIKGNIDPVHTLLHGNQNTIFDAVKHRMEVAKPGGGYILSTACAVAPHTEPASITYLSEQGRKMGKY